MKNILSFDIEEWFHGVFQRNTSVPHVFRSDLNVPPLLDLLHEKGVKATFFVVGESLRDNRLLKRMVDDGHEIGFHTMDHKLLSEKTPDELAYELRSFRARVKDATGADCLGFRAPSFSLSKKTAWATECLAKEGYAYDSSIFPAKTPIYGNPGAPLTSYYMDREDPGSPGDSGVREFPLTVARYFGLNVPIAGGFYLRAIPEWLLGRMMRGSVGAGRPLVLYVHNWELDRSLPRYNLGFKANTYCYHNQEATWGRLVRLLEEFEFTTFAQALKESRQ